MIKQTIMAIALFGLVTACGSQKNTTSSTKSTESRPQSQQQGSQRGGQQGGKPSIDEIFKMDANGDGKLSKSEVSGPLANDFSTIDTNGDGYLSKSEVENAPKPQRGQGGHGGGQGGPRR